MERRKVLIKRIDEEGGWRLLWSDTLGPADEHLFTSIKEAWSHRPSPDGGSRPVTEAEPRETARSPG